MMFGRRYFLESLVWIVAFVLAIKFAQWLAGLWPADSPLRPLAIVPAVLALCAGMWVEIRQVVRMDEMQRHIYLVATMTGSCLAMLFCTVAYLGEILHLWARVAPIFVVAVIGLGFAGGLLVAKRRYA